MLVNSPHFYMSCSLCVLFLCIWGTYVLYTCIVCFNFRQRQVPASHYFSSEFSWMLLLLYFSMGTFDLAYLVAGGQGGTWYFLLGMHQINRFTWKKKSQL